MNKYNGKKYKNKDIYNRVSLCIDPFKTLIIIDWDDTLYPTSWSINQGIDLTCPNSRYKYIKYFEQLDTYLSTTLLHIKTLGDVVIITNALPEWIELSVSVLPKTKLCIKTLEIVSARQKYQKQNKMENWKKFAFVEELTKRSKIKQYTNILSLGDADFEYNALINLYHTKISPHKYLKSIKFIKSTKYDILLEQIKMIHEHISDICIQPRHIDLIFDSNH